MRLQKIVSGGQTGVDRAALDAALDAGVPAGGWCPKGRRAEDGAIDGRYPLRETPSEAYGERTAWNVRDSDGTLILASGTLAGGTELTARVARALERPLFVVPLDAPLPALQEVADWVERNGIEVLNVAGPREEEVPGIYAAARTFLEALLARGVRPRRPAP